MRRRLPRAGLTFIEYLCVASLLTLVSGVLLDFSIRQVDLIQVSEAEAEVRTHAQLAIEAMTRELRHATRAAVGSPPNLSVPPAPGNTAILFYLPADLDGNGLIIDAAGLLEWDLPNLVQYQYVPAARQVQRVAGATTRVLATDVTSATFEDRTIDASLGVEEVRIRLVLQRTTPRGRAVSTAASAIITLRN